MRQALAQQAFLRLSMHAKLHKKLNELDTKEQQERRRRETLQRIEADEIRAYAQDDTYSHLETLKARVLAINFLEK